MQYFDIASILTYIVMSALFVMATLIVGAVLRPKNPYGEKLSTYECGEETIGTSFIQFNVRFYIIALIFLIFDVEIAILFPWATIFKKYGLPAFADMGIFILILAVGFVYVWVKGDLEWIKTLGEVVPRKEPEKESKRT